MKRLPQDKKYWNKKTKIILYLIPILLAMTAKKGISDQGKEAPRPPGANEVLIGPNVVIMPTGRMLLVKKESSYCAIKFTRFETEDEDKYAWYESYYQDDKTGNFSNHNVEFRKEELSNTAPSCCCIFCGRLGLGPPISFSDEMEIYCGPINLWWTGKGTVYFYGGNQREGDYGIELAPTKWTDISDVNVFYPRLKWYKFDVKRKDQIISVDQLWED